MLAFRIGLLIFCLICDEDKKVRAAFGPHKYSYLIAAVNRLLVMDGLVIMVDDNNSQECRGDV